MTDWYEVIRAARILNCSAIQLAREPKVWVAWALQSEAAERIARDNPL